MTVYSGTEYAKRNASPVKFVSQNEIGGKIRCIHANFVAPTGGLAANDTVRLAELPRNATVLGHLSRFKSSLLGAGRTWDVGYEAHTDESDDSSVSAVVDAFVNGAVASAAVDQLFTAATVGGSAPEHTAAGKMIVTAKLLGAAMAAAETIEMWLFYIEP